MTHIKVRLRLETLVNEPARFNPPKRFTPAFIFSLLLQTFECDI